MSYEFCYDDQREVLIFRFPDEHICITYFLEKRCKGPTENFQIWLQVRSKGRSYRMRSYAFQFFQQHFRRIKCMKAKKEAKDIIRHLRSPGASPSHLWSAMSEYELLQKQAMEGFEKEVVDGLSVSFYIG